MATELASGYVSVGGDTRPLARDIRAAFRGFSKDAGAEGQKSGAAYGSRFSRGMNSDKRGKSEGRKFSRGFTSGLRSGLRSTMAAFTMIGAASAVIIKNIDAVARGMVHASRMIRVFSASLMVGATGLRLVASTSLAKLAGWLKVVARFASILARDIARVTAAIMVLSAVGKLVSTLTRVGKVLGMVTVGSAVALGALGAVTSVISNFTSGPMVQGLLAISAAMGTVAAAAAGILGPALVVAKIGFSGLAEGAKEFMDQFKEADKAFNQMIGQRMAPLLVAFRNLRQEIVGNFSQALVPAFEKTGGLISKLQGPLGGLSTTLGRIGTQIAQSIAGPAAMQGWNNMISGSNRFFSSLAAGENGLGSLFSGLISVLGTAAREFASTGATINETLLGWGEKLRNISGEELRASLTGISTAFRNVMAVAGPAFTLFREFGARAATGLAPGFQAIGQAIRESLPGLMAMADRLMPALGQALANIAPLLPGLVHAFSPWATTLSILAPHLATIVAKLAPLAPYLLTAALAVKTIGVAMTAWNATMFASSVVQGVFAAATGRSAASLGTNTVALAAHRAALIAGSVASGIATAATTAFGVALTIATSPITWIIVAIGLLVGALVLLYKKNETFRNFVQAAWAGIKAAIAVVWEWLSGTVFPLFKQALQMVGQVMSWLWQNIMLPAWTAIKFAIQLWWAYAQIVFKVFMAVLKAVGAVVTWLWQTIIVPAFKAIKFVIALWWAGVQIYFKIWQAVIKAAGAVVMWLWHNIISPAFNAIGSIISGIWNGVIKPVWDGFKAAIQVVGDAALWLWNNAITPAWEGIKSAITTVWNIVKPIFENIGKGFKVMGDIATKVGDAMKNAFSGVVDIIKAPLHAIGGLLAKLPGSIMGVDIPGVSTIKEWGQTLQSLRSGGYINAAPGGFIVNAAASRKHRGLLSALGGQRISGPGTGTSDSIPALGPDGRPIARVSNGETYFTPGLAGALGGWLGALNGGFGDGGPAAAFASGGSIPYGMPTGTSISYGASGFPDWVYAIAKEFGVKASTYPGHQESDRGEAGYAPNPQRFNRGIDWSGSVPNMQKFADTLFSLAPKLPQLEQIIWMNPGTGKKVGWAGGKPDSSGSYFASDYSGHQDHVHTRQSASFSTNIEPPNVANTTVPEGQTPDWTPDGQTPDTTTQNTTTQNTTQKKEPFSSVKTTRDLFGKWGQITGESLFDIFLPSQFSDSIDPVAIANRYMLRGDEDSSTTDSTYGQTVGNKTDTSQQELKLKQDYDAAKLKRKRKYEDEALALKRKYEAKQLSKEDYENQKLALKRKYEDDNAAAQKTYEESKAKLKAQGTDSNWNPPANPQLDPSAPVDNTKPTNGRGRDNYIKDTVAATKSLKLPLDAAIIAVGTQLVETGIKMYANAAVPDSLKFPHDAVGSDHDSVGLYQQRQAGWGTLAQRMSAFESSKLFLNAMTKKFPNWASMPKGEVAQGVQVSAFPDRYATKMEEARQLLIGKFDRGGVVPPGISLVENKLRRYEQAAVFTPSQWETLQQLPAGNGGNIDARTIIESLVVQDWREAQRELKQLGIRNQMRYSRSHTK
ncbi:tail length tape measure protein [Gordonia phage Emalyn]|uniref:Tape measure protein n=1 Tax=Gordonia phage Emalyn TaxID=1821552 RepID=A0A142KBV1_9CAUD|nr:tail length tape measure protein [Gordonia phage Emalyn]AMS03584.1 tape measure protein [Gordonia phage Emalyn]